MVALFDHLVGASKQCWGYDDPQRFGCLEVDHQLELCWLLYRQIAGLTAFEYLVDIVASATKQIVHVRSI